jgi:hypothetical protein
MTSYCSLLRSCVKMTLFEAPRYLVDAERPGWRSHVVND